MEIANITEELSRLEHLEAQLAIEYGMKGDIDSVEVFDETKARAFSRGDEMSVSAVKDLYTLYKLRVLVSSGNFSSYSNLEYVRILLR